MSHVKTVKRTVRFGGIVTVKPSGPTAFSSNFGASGPAGYGGYGIAAADVANFSTFTPVGQTILDTGAPKLVIPKLNGESPIAISIAPDSPIPACYLSLGGRMDEESRVLVGVGNPYVGCLDGVDNANVTLVEGVPAITPTNFAVYWDGDARQTGDIALGSTTNALGWPLRLEFWYGTMPGGLRAHWRPPQVAHLLVGAANGQGRSLVVCTQGRRRIEVSAKANGLAAATITCFAGHPRKQADTTLDLQYTHGPLVLDDIGSTSMAVDAAGTDNANAQFFGNPINLLTVQVAVSNANSGGGNNNIQVRVIAHDE